MSGEQLDLASEASIQPDGSTAAERRFVGIQFACCDVYCRVYLNRTGDAYQGHCPRCSKPVRIRIAPGGTDARFFTVY